MKVIPSALINVQSDAEKTIHGYLSEIELSNRDVALHSLNLGKHEYKRWGEADFVLVSRKGILLIEVKGGRVACRDGIWEFTNRYGETTRKTESPAAQAKSAFFALKNHYLDDQFGRDLARVPVGWAVVFTGIDRLVSTGKSGLPEQPDEITAYRASTAGPRAFKKFIEAALGYWSQKIRGEARLLEAEAVGRITAFLRPNFERFPLLNSQLSGLREELSELTTEQYQRLEDIQENDRILIRGGAGTGKTFLAVAAARYEAAGDMKVLLVTRSLYLATFITGHELPAGVTATSLDELGNENTEDGKCDVLIVDEGQDLCQWETLELLDKVLKGGIEAGRWRWFCDPNHQVSPSFPLDEEVLAYIGSLSFKQRLSRNIRNTPPIVTAIQNYAQADIGIPRPIGQGGDVVFLESESIGERVEQAANQVRQWVREHEVAASEIAILTPFESDVAVLVSAVQDRGIRAEKLSERTCRQGARKAAVVATIEQFKGLERPVVFVAGLCPDEDMEELQGVVYRGFTRANHTLVVSCTAGNKRALMQSFLSK
jgi:hypothetical protein